MDTEALLIPLAGKDSSDTKRGHNKAHSFREIEYSINASLHAQENLAVMWKLALNV